MSGDRQRTPPRRESIEHSAVQINVVKGCVSVVLVHATFDHVYARGSERALIFGLGR